MTESKILEHVDVEAALVAANAGGWRWSDYDDDLYTRFFRALGMIDPNIAGNILPTGVWRRFAAGLSSVAYRRDGNTHYHFKSVPLKEGDHGHIPSGVANDEPVGAFVLTWWSTGGTWGSRAWWFQGTVVVCMDDCGQTSLEFCQDATLTVAGNGGATEFFGLTVGQLLHRAVHGLMARHQLRHLIGKIWEEAAAVSLDDWLSEATANREYIVVSEPPNPVQDEGPADERAEPAREGMGRRAR